MAGVARRGSVGGRRVSGAGGCAGSGPAEEVTFSKHIAPILQRSCQKCHRPDSLAPMSLIDYAEVRPWGPRHQVPHGASATSWASCRPGTSRRTSAFQRFKDDPSLSDAEIALIATWADNGAPEGNPADLPPPVAFIDVDEWEIGQPDLIVSSPSVEVEPDAPDWWGSIGEVPTGADRGPLRGGARVQGNHRVQRGDAAQHGRRAVRGAPRDAGRERPRPRSERDRSAGRAAPLADPRGRAQTPTSSIPGRAGS